MADVPEKLDTDRINKLGSGIESALSDLSPHTKTHAIFVSAKEYLTLGGKKNLVHRFAIRTHVEEMDCHIANAFVYPTTRLIEVIPYRDSFVAMSEEYCRRATLDLQGKLNQGTLLPE